MRTLKFRVFDGKEMEHFTLSRLYWRGEEFGDYNFPENEEVMQFTGLLDKNGKEIYEGDVMKTVYEGIVTVIFRIGAFWCTGEKLNINIPVYEFVQDGECEVIGNIYENKELINT